MAKWRTLQNSFLAGEVSPRFLSSVNTDMHDQALAEILNGLVLLHGPVSTRPGTNFLSALAGVGALGTARVWPFFDLLNRNAVALWTNGQVEIVASALEAPPRSTPDKAQISGYQQVLINPYFVQGLTGWNNSGVSTSGDTSYSVRETVGDLVEMHIRFRNSRPVSINDLFIRQVFTTAESDSFIISIKATKLLNTLADIDTRLRVKLGTTPGGAEIIERVFEINESLTTVAESVIIPGGVAGQLYFEVVMELDGLTAGATTSEDYRIFLSEVLLYSYTGEVITPDTVNTPYGDIHLEALHFIQSPFNQQELIVLHPAFPPYALWVDSGSWVFTEYDFTTPPEGMGPNNYPSIATAFQGRLILTGATNDSETIWVSRSGDWLDFEVPAVEPVADDPLKLTPTERGVNTWINGFKRLLFGNTVKEFSVDSLSGLLQPGDAGVFQQGSYGALRLPQKFTIGNSVVLATGGNTSLRLVKYSEQDGGYVADDKLLRAEHLGRKVIRHHFHIKHPHEMLWCVMLDGSISVMSFDEELGVYAWSHLITDGRFIDGCVVVNELGVETVVLVVERVIEGTTVKYLETISDLRNLQNWHHLDSHVRVFLVEGQTVIGGLQHLEAKEVSVFTDDNFMGTRVVVDGQIEIDGPAAHVDIGLAFDQRFVTLPQGSVTPNVGLTAQKRFSKVGIQGIFSHPPLINGERAGDRSAQALMDIPQPAELVLNSDAVDMDWEETKVVTISEVLPIRLTLSAIYGRLTSNEV